MSANLESEPIPKVMLSPRNAAFFPCHLFSDMSSTSINEKLFPVSTVSDYITSERNLQRKKQVHEK